MSELPLPGPEAPAQPPKARLWLRLLPNLLGAALLGWFLHGLDTAGFWRALRALHLSTVAGIAAASFVETATQGFMFYCLCHAGQGPARHVLLSFATQAGNVLLPLRTGELLRPLYLKRWRPENTYKELLGWTLADKGLQIVAVLPFLLVGLYLFAADAQLSLALRRLGLFIGGLVVAVAAAGVLWMRRRLRQNLGAGAAGLPLKAWLGASFWAIAMWGASYVVYWLAIGDPRVALALLVGVGFGSGIPSLPAGVGAYEAAFLWVGEHAQLPHDQVLAAAVVSHAVQLLTTLLLGVPVLLWWGWPRRRDSLPADL